MRAQNQLIFFLTQFTLDVHWIQQKHSHCLCNVCRHKFHNRNDTGAIYQKLVVPTQNPSLAHTQQLCQGSTRDQKHSVYKGHTDKHLILYILTQAFMKFIFSILFHL